MRRTYYGRFNELRLRYRICYHLDGRNPKDFDVIVTCVAHSDALTKHKVIMNRPDLTGKDLAIICGRGDIGAGYEIDGSIVIVQPARRC